MKPRTMHQVMGNLPKPRITPGRPFLTTGVDFCGPVKVHFRIRGKGPVKACIAIFVCFATKAVHLELVSELTSDAFIASLKRFVGRRGLCKTIYCDNATNFVGARSNLKELRELFLSHTHQRKILQWCGQDNIEWKPIPPRSPHFGGLWEAAVKSAKHHLIRATAEASLTYEEFNTFLIQVEAILISRPITPLSSDPNDLSALTPGHFLIGGPLVAIVEPDTKDVNIKLNARFQHLRLLHQHFWQRFSLEYLNQLQIRHKWCDETMGIREGSLVLIKEDNLPPLNWITGRVIKLYPGEDNKIRVADVKTSTGVYKRSIVKLCLLPIDDNN